MLMLIVVILGLAILYAGLRTHYSVGISQIWIAGILFWLSFRQYPTIYFGMQTPEFFLR